MSFEAICKVAQVAGNARAWQRGSGHSVVPRIRYASRLRAGSHALSGSGRGYRQTMRARGVCAPALKHQLTWEGLHPERWRAEPRSEPDSGNPTVRDRREASGNVTMGAGLRATAKAVEWPPDPKVRAPDFYPDIRTLRAKRQELETELRITLGGHSARKVDE